MSETLENFPTLVLTVRKWWIKQYDGSGSFLTIVLMDFLWVFRAAFTTTLA